MKRYLPTIARALQILALTGFYSAAKPALATNLCVAYEKSTHRDFDAYQLGIAFRDVMVTAKPIEVVREHLKLTDDFVAQLRQPGASVVSLGEGMSELLPFLIATGAHVRAVDLWYHSELLDQGPFSNSALAAMADFQRRYRPYLIRANALHTGLPEESQSVVLSNLLANNLHINEQLRLVQEAIRLLRVGGNARIYLTLSPDHLDEKTDGVVRAFLDENYSQFVKYLVYEGLIYLHKSDRLPAGFIPKNHYQPDQVYEDLAIGAPANFANWKRESIEEIAVLRGQIRQHPDDLSARQRLRLLQSRLPTDPFDP